MSICGTPEYMSPEVIKQIYKNINILFIEYLFNKYINVIQVIKG